MTPSTASATSSACRCTTGSARNWPGAAPRSFSKNIWGRGRRTPQLAFRSQLLYSAPMTRVLEDAIEKVRQLPEDRQACVAEALEQIAAAGSDVFTVTAQHRAALLARL